MDKIIFVALVCATLQFLAFSELGYTFSEIITTPILSGIIVGFIMGDTSKGLLIGAQIQLMYIGMIYPGGIVPADGGLAALIAIPIAIQNGLEPGAAVAIGIPFGVIGGLLYEVKKTINIFGIHKLDDMIEKNPAQMVRKYQLIFPVAVAFLLSFPIVLLAVATGPTIIGKIITAIPEWVMHGMEVAGGFCRP